MQSKVIKNNKLKELLVNSWINIKSRCKSIKILVAMQLKEKLNVNGNKISGLKLLSTTIFSIVKFALIVG